MEENLIIQYKTKDIKDFMQGPILAQMITYEIDEEDMMKIASLQSPEPNLKRIFLYKDWGNFEMVVDNIPNGKIVQGGVKDGKYLLKQYLVETGLNELLYILSMSENI